MPLIIIYGFSLLLSLDSYQNNIDYSKKNLTKLNDHLQDLDFEIRKNKQIYACKSSKKAIQIIKENYKGFKVLEPYYDWHEISEAIVNISKDNC